MKSKLLHGAIGTRAAVLLFALTVASCATPNVDPDYQLQTTDAHGLLIVSLTQEGLGPHEKLVWLYRKVDGTVKDRLISENSGDALDWRNPNGRLIYIALPAGYYEFYGAGFARAGPGPNPSYHVDSKGAVTASSAYHAGFDAARYRSLDAEPFSIPFEIRPGAATYIGDLHFQWSDTEGLAKVQRFNRSERDLSLLRERLPLVLPAQIQNAAPRERSG